jgi:hypothetical protein
VSPLPTDRDTTDSAADHVADHNTLHAEYNTPTHTHSGTSVQLKRTVVSGIGNRTTTSTTRTPVDATNLAYVTFTLAVGDVVELALYGTASNSSAGFGVAFDFEVDRPTSANIYVADGVDYGVQFLYIASAGYPSKVAAVATFIATEAGSHGFRPVWYTDGAGTASLWTAASGGNDQLATFLLKHWPAAMVG